MSEREQLIKDLRKLRVGRGVTPQKIADFPRLMLALGSPRDPEDALRRVLLSLPQTRDVLALTRAYAMDDNLQTLLSGRRNDYASEVGRHVDTVEDWENRAIELMASVILTPRTSRLLPGIRIRLEVTDGLLFTYSNSIIDDGLSYPVGGLYRPPFILYYLAPVEGTYAHLDISITFKRFGPKAVWWCRTRTFEGIHLGLEFRDIPVYADEKVDSRDTDKFSGTDFYTEPQQGFLYAVCWRM